MSNMFYARSGGCSLRIEASSGPTWQGAASRRAILILNSLVHDMRQNRPALRSEEVEQAVAHVLSSDYPEQEQWMLGTARECGFSPARTLLRDEFYGSWAFVAAPGETG
jgi:hypothetical protein